MGEPAILLFNGETGIYAEISLVGSGLRSYTTFGGGANFKLSPFTTVCGVLVIERTVSSDYGKTWLNGEFILDFIIAIESASYFYIYSNDFCSQFS